MITYIHNNSKHNIEVDKELLCKESKFFEFLFSSYEFPTIYSHSNINHEQFLSLLLLIKNLSSNNNWLQHDHVNSSVKLIQCDGINDNVYRIYPNNNLHIDLTRIKEYILICNVYYFDKITDKLIDFMTNLLHDDPELNDISIECYNVNKNIDVEMVKKNICKQLVLEFNRLIDVHSNTQNARRSK